MGYGKVQSSNSPNGKNNLLHPQGKWIVIKSILAK
jgi:hypothetical protein